jgi:response regulator of citrate/malate metabolism
MATFEVQYSKLTAATKDEIAAVSKAVVIQYQYRLHFQVDSSVATLLASFGSFGRPVEGEKCRHK